MSGSKQSDHAKTSLDTIVVGMRTLTVATVQLAHNEVERHGGPEEGVSHSIFFALALFHDRKNKWHGRDHPRCCSTVVIP